MPTRTSEIARTVSSLFERSEIPVRLWSTATAAITVLLPRLPSASDENKLVVSQPGSRSFEFHQLEPLLSKKIENSIGTGYFKWIPSEPIQQIRRVCHPP